MGVSGFCEKGKKKIKGLEGVIGEMAPSLTSGEKSLPFHQMKATPKGVKRLNFRRTSIQYFDDDDSSQRNPLTQIVLQASAFDP